MPRNGSGTYTRPQSDYVPGTTILATSVNSDLNDMAQALTASIARDGQTTPTGNMPMGNFRHTGVADGTARTDYAALGQTQNGAFLWGGTAGGTANAATISLNPPLAAYAAGQAFRFQTGAAANTSAVTLNVNSLGAVAVNKGDGTTALGAGDLPASAMVTVVHDGTRFRLIDPAPFEDLSVTTAKIADGAVTFAKIQNITTAQVLGRVTAGSGAIEEIPLGNSAAALSLGINRGTEQATSAGTQVQYDFGSIPAGVRRVKLLLKQVSTNGTSHLAVRLGTSGGIVSSGYDCMFSYDAPGVGGVTSVGTGAFGISNGSIVDTHTGIMTFENQSGNLWLCSYIGMMAVNADRYRTHCSGFVDLGGGLTQLRLTTNSGTPVFDTGAIQLKWEF